jgi:large subunit ribosomal protein L4
VRSHQKSLPKKVRRLGLKFAICDKLRNGEVLIIDDIKLESISTKKCASILQHFNLHSVLFLCGNLIRDNNFYLSSKNIPHCSFISQTGINVYDVLKHKSLALSLSAARALQEQLSL